MNNTAPQRPRGSGLAGIRNLGVGSLRGGGLLPKLVMGLAAVVLLLCLCVVFVVPRLFGGGGNAGPVAVATAVGGGFVPSGSSSTPRLGTVTMTSSVGDKNKPGAAMSIFPANSPIVYAVVQGVDIPAGSTYFARWVRDGQPFEDTTQITADKRYQDTYIEFHIQPNQGQALPTGNYEVQIFANGNPALTSRFVVR
ncbi:MAG TPA: hypothetical protein VM536_15360 [Chloroflexia bacterium]|nr:hypothetical protein [Chloroflexia bacterium]